MDEVKSKTKLVLTDENVTLSLHLIEDIRSLGLLHELVMNAPGEYIPGTGNLSKGIPSLTLKPELYKLVHMQTELLKWHPGIKKTVSFPSASFIGLKEAIVDSLGVGFWFENGVKKTDGLSFNYDETIAVLSALKNNIAVFAEHFKIEPSPENISQLLALGYIRSISRNGLVRQRVSVSYKDLTPTDAVWNEMLKYTAAGYATHQIVSFFTIKLVPEKTQNDTSNYKSFKSLSGNKKVPFITFDNAEELGLKDIPQEWAQLALSAYFKAEITF